MELKFPISESRIKTSLARSFMGKGKIIAEVEFVSGEFFKCNTNKVFFYRAPDAFFGSKRRIKVADFLGVAKLDEQQVVRRARDLVGRLGFIDPQLISETPQIRAPLIPNPNLIPRLVISWTTSEDNIPLTRVDLEIDASSGELKHLEYYDLRAVFPPGKNSNRRVVPAEKKESDIRKEK